MITQEYLKSILDYNPDTGVFIRKKSNNTKLKNGSVAGYLRADGYIYIGINKKQYLAHRLAWLYVYGIMPEFLDHINCNRSDNKISNLRKCTKQQNSLNSKLQKNNTSGIKNVTWSKTTNKWVVALVYNKKSYHFGYFDDLELADLVAQEARNKLHGEYVNHN